MLVVEFFADKIPGVDSVWDAVHTFIRIPAGAALAAGVFGGDSAVWTTVAALIGGTLAATSHAAKATTRAAANTSPEPFSNIGLSLLGDAAVPAMLWLAWEHPVWFFVGLALATAVMLALIVVLFRFLRALLRRWRGEPAAGCIVSAMRLLGWLRRRTRARMGCVARWRRAHHAEEPALAQDLHEQVLRLPVTVKDSFGPRGNAPHRAHRVQACRRRAVSARHHEPRPRHQRAARAAGAPAFRTAVALSREHGVRGAGADARRLR